MTLLARGRLFGADEERLAEFIATIAGDWFPACAGMTRELMYKQQVLRFPGAHSVRPRPPISPSDQVFFADP